MKRDQTSITCPGRVGIVMGRGPVRDVVEESNSVTLVRFLYDPDSSFISLIRDHLDVLDRSYMVVDPVMSTLT